MTNPLCALILVCATLSLAHAQSPSHLSKRTTAEEQAFNIPKIDAVVIDGKGDDWKQDGFRVETLAGESGAVLEPNDFDPVFRLAWDDSGLLVLLTVRSDQVTEADEPCDLWKKNGVEVFFGERVGSPQYFQVLAGTGADTRFPTLRTFIVDLRKPASPQKLEVEAASTRTADGYVLEMRLPWSNLSIKPHVGEEVAFQLCANHFSKTGSRFSVGWSPWLDTYSDPNSMVRVRLAQKASPPALIAAKASQNNGGSCVSVVAPIALAGKKVVAKMNGDIVATNTLQPSSGRARTAFLLPRGDVEVSSDGGDGRVVLHDVAARFDAITNRAIGIGDTRIIFKPCGFSGEQFPPCAFEKPNEVEKSYGNCVLTPTFYDADYNEVKTAAKPGRYGAIVQVKTESGKTFKRFITLYRKPKEWNWSLPHIRFSSVEFPPELGLSPEVVNERIKDVEDFFTGQVLGGFSDDSGAATLFAGLWETRPGAVPSNRTSAWALDQKWWYGLKKKTGDLRNDHIVHVPAGYEKDPQKKWPLLLFLHGSGERGYSINRIKSSPLAVLSGRSDFPCIVVAPQCSPGEWWSPWELNDLLDRVEAQYRVDSDRVYLTGLSMGGFGSWALATEFPERFAAVAPICGGGDPHDVERIKNTPIWVFHGAKDPTVPIERSQEMVDALKKIGGNVKFTVYPDVNHDSWKPAYATPELYEWLLQQHRAAEKR